MDVLGHYDVAIVGGGIGGIMSAYRFTQKMPGISVCLLKKETI